jgi:predicted Zn-dependent peptidase
LDEDEIRRARTQLESAFLFEEETALDSAMKIGRWEAQCVGGYKRLADVDELYGAVDSVAVQAVVERYFSPDTWNVVHSLPTQEVASDG